MRAVILALVLLFPGVALGDWQKFCTSTTPPVGRPVAGSIQPGEWVCHDPQAGEDPSPLNIAACENVDIFWYDDLSGAATSTATVVLYTCPFSSSNTTTCQPLNGGTTLSATNTEVFGAAGIWLYADVTADSNDPRLIVRCAQPSAK
jgi:hypothetical protein